MNENGAKELRQKAINLIYLILLALLFSYIPSDFMDSVYHSDQSMNQLSEDVERLGAENKLLILRALRLKNQDAFNETQAKLIEVDQITGEAITTISDIKFQLISVDKYNEFGFLSNGKRENLSNDIMFDKGQATKLIASLKDFKSGIKATMSSDMFDAIDSILPTPDLLRHSDGDFTPIESFYFYKNPLNISVLNLSHFRGRVEEVRSLVIRKIIKQTFEDYEEEMPQEVVEIVGQSESSIGNADFIEEFYEELQKQSKLDEDDKRDPFLFVESLTDSVYPAGQPIRFNVQFDTALSKSIQTVVKANGQQIQAFIMSKPGPFIYSPEKKGNYQISFRSDKLAVNKRVKVIDVEPILQNQDLATLYIGIDNPLNIRTSEFEDTEELEATISKGQILKKGKNFYARVEEPGLVDVKVVANMPYGQIKVAAKQFVIRELKAPIAKVNEQASGNEIEKIDAIQLRNLEVESVEYIVDDKFFVSDFDLTIIYNDYTAILKPIHNIGASINAVSLDAISRAQSGDIIIFENIRAKSTEGKEMDLAPINISLR